MPCPGLLHPEPLQESTADPDLRRRRSHTALSQSLWGLWVLVPLFERSEHLWREWGLILNTNSPLLPSCWGFSFALGHGVSPHGHSRISLFILKIYRYMSQNRLLHLHIKITRF